MAKNVSFSTLVRGAPDLVYDAMTTAEGLDGWFTNGTSIDATPGGSLTFRWQNWGPENFTGEMSGPVLEAQRPDRFVFRWLVDSGGYESTVEVDFKQTPKGTLVQLVEHGYQDGPDCLQDMLNRASGWAQALTLMKFFVEHGVTY